MLDLKSAADETNRTRDRPQSDSTGGVYAAIQLIPDGVRYNGKTESMVRCVPQGSPVSLALFNIFIEYLLVKLREAVISPFRNVIPIADDIL